MESPTQTVQMFSIEAMCLRMALSENVRLEFKKSISDDANFVVVVFF